MQKYVLWNKKDDIYRTAPGVSGKLRWTAQEYIDQEAPWAGLPGVDIVLSGVQPNGDFFLEFEERYRTYERMGANLNRQMSKNDVLIEMERFENEVLSVPDLTPTTEERIAAALEYNNMKTHGRVSPMIVEQNFTRGTWDLEMVNDALKIKEITKDEFARITEGYTAAIKEPPKGKATVNL